MAFGQQWSRCIFWWLSCAQTPEWDLGLHSLPVSPSPLPQQKARLGEWHRQRLWCILNKREFGWLGSCAVLQHMSKDKLRPEHRGAARITRKPGWNMRFCVTIIWGPLVKTHRCQWLRDASLLCQISSVSIKRRFYQEKQ